MKLLITVASMVIMFSNSLIYAAYPYSKWQGEKLNVEIINNTEHQFTFIAEKINDTEYSPIVYDKKTDVVLPYNKNSYNLTMPLNPETRRHDIKMITKIFLSNDLSNGRTEKDVIAACRAENLLSYYTHRHDMVGSFELDNFPHSGLFVKSGLNKFKCYSDASNSPSDTLKILIENNKN